MKLWFRNLIVGFWLLVSLLSAGMSQAQTDYERLTDRHNIQNEFPNQTPAPEPDDPPFRGNFSFADLTLSNILILGLLAALLIGFIVYIASNVRAFGQSKERQRVAVAKANTVEVWGTVPDDGWNALLNRLQLSSDYALALHEMLLAAIGYCQKELALHIPRARTPREIHDGLPEDFVALEDFGTLVKGAELAWFGGKPVDRTTFQNGLDALRRIVSL